MAYTGSYLSVYLGLFFTLVFQGSLHTGFCGFTHSCRVPSWQFLMLQQPWLHGQNQPIQKLGSMIAT